MKPAKKLSTQLFLIFIISTIVSIIITVAFNNIVNVTDTNQECLVIREVESKDSLVSVQVLLRHGHRTPEPGKLYRTDPYNNYTFYPENYGEITNKGRKCAFNLGVSLRKRYDWFVGSGKFYPGIVKSYASGYHRTQMTLQCVHAGLFPNSDSNSILGIPWRPVTYTVFEHDEDNVLGIMAHCKSLKLPLTRPKDNETLALFQYLSEKSGENIDNYYDLIKISNAFHVETAYGLELPDWGKALYPEPLSKLDELGWNIFAMQNIRYGAGGLLKMITTHALQAVTTDARPKVVLYAGHDYNFVLLRHSLGLDFEPTTFCGHLIFELHKINEEYGFKIFYNNHKHGHPVLLKVPFCGNGTLCMLPKFIQHTKWYYDPTPICY